MFTFSALGAEGKKRVAVFPFRVNNIDVAGVSNEDASELVAKMLINELTKTNKFSVVEYNEVIKVLEELGLDEAPLDEETQIKAAKKLGVEAIIVGWIERFEVSRGGGGVSIWGGYSADVDTTSADVELEAELIDSFTAVKLQSMKEGGSDTDSSLDVWVDYHGVDFGSTDFYESVLGHAAQEAVKNIAEEVENSKDKIKEAPEGTAVDSGNLIEGLVADVTETEVTLNIGSNDGVKAGTRFDVFRITKEIKDPETGEIIKKVEEKIGQIAIFETGDSWSTGNILGLEPEKIIQVSDLVREIK